MGEFFGSIYCWFENFFGQELANYLWGIASPLSTTNSFIGLGLTMFGITLAVLLIYYYVIDHPRLSIWWGWLVFLVINAVVNFLVGWQWVLADYYEGKMVTVDPATEKLSPLKIGTSEILRFGVSDMILSIAAYIIFTFMVKWWSRNSSHSPFNVREILELVKK